MLPYQLVAILRPQLLVSMYNLIRLHGPVRESPEMQVAMDHKFQLGDGFAKVRVGRTEDLRGSHI